MSIRARISRRPARWPLAACAAVCLLAAAGGCGGARDHAPDVVVNILPQSWLVHQIGGEDVRVEVLVGPGQSPHTFDPTPRQIARLLDADLFVRAGVPFERSLLPKIERMPGAPPILAPGLEGLEPAEAGPAPDADGRIDGQDPGHDHGGLDPHTWLDPALFRAEAVAVRDALCGLRPEAAARFRQRAAALDDRLAALDADLHRELAPYRGATFFVFHPAYGHFAAAYGLRQVAIELDGHEPGARHLADVIGQARAAGAKAIIVQPQFSQETARRVADEIGAGVVALDPLAYDYEQNLRFLADSLAELFSARTEPAAAPGGDR